MAGDTTELAALLRAAIGYSNIEQKDWVTLLRERGVKPMSGSTLQRWMHGKSEPPAQAVALILGISNFPSSLLGAQPNVAGLLQEVRNLVRTQNDLLHQQSEILTRIENATDPLKRLAEAATRDLASDVPTPTSAETKTGRSDNPPAST